MFISGAKFEEYCFNISRDILYSFYQFSSKPQDVITFPVCIIHNAKTSLSLKRERTLVFCLSNTQQLFFMSYRLRMSKKSVKCWMFGGQCAELQKQPRKQLQLLRSERDFNPRPPGFNTDHSATLSPLHPQLVFCPTFSPNFTICFLILNLVTQMFFFLWTNRQISVPFYPLRPLPYVETGHTIISNFFLGWDLIPNYGKVHIFKNLKNQRLW